MKKINLVLTFTFLSVLLSGCGMTGPLYKETNVGKKERLLKEAKHEVRLAERELGRAKKEEKLEQEAEAARVIQQNQADCEEGDEMACFKEGNRINAQKCKEGDESACEVEDLKKEVECDASSSEKCEADASDENTEITKEDTEMEASDE